jgi:hypothetical protein
MVTIFVDFRQFAAKKMAFLFKKTIYIGSKGGYARGCIGQGEDPHGCPQVGDQVI